MPIAAILSAAERQATVADALSRVYAEELAAVQADLDRRLAGLVVDAQAGSETATALAARALALRTEIRNLLVAAGYDDLASVATDAGFARMAHAIGQLRLAAEVSAFTTQDATRIAALQELSRLDLLAEGDAVSTAIWRAVLRGVYAQQPASELIADLQSVTALELRHVGTLYDTAVSIFGRQVQELKATGEPDELFLFAGPIDAKTRPFCLERAGKVFRRAEIQTWDNGNLPGPSEIVLGGYNCRHQLVPVSAFSELVDLQGTDRRVPEMEAQHAAAMRERARRKAA